MLEDINISVEVKNTGFIIIIVIIVICYIFMCIMIYSVIYYLVWKQTILYADLR